MKCFSSDTYFAQLPKGHPFPMRKFPESAQLIRELELADVIDPGFIRMEDLYRAHTPEYVKSIQTGNYNELTAARLGLPWHPTIWTRSLSATAGTLKAARVALEEGLAANLAGGTHHAFSDRGEGYCVFNDVVVATRALHTEEPFLHVMVIDLDAHQGNGTAASFANQPHVFTYSLHVGKNYPSRKEPSTLDVEVSRYATGSEYFDRLHNTLARAIESFEPDLIFYNAGVDVHENDRFGQMKLSTEQVRQRDEYVLRMTQKLSIPTCIVYGGGYNRDPHLTTLLHVQTIRVASQIHSQGPDASLT